MQLVLPLIVSDAEGDLLVLVVADQKKIVELSRDELFEVVDLLGCEKSVVGCRVDRKCLAEEDVHILLSILDRLNSNLETELLSLSFKHGQPLLLLLLLPAFLLQLVFLNDILNLLSFLLLDHVVQLQFLVFSILLHFFKQFCLDFGIEELFDLL